MHKGLINTRVALLKYSLNTSLWVDLTRLDHWLRLLKGVTLRNPCLTSSSCLLCGDFSGKWVIPSCFCAGAWLISDHYPISAPLSGWCAFVLAFISIASYTTSRLWRDCGAWERACHRGLAETVRFCDHASFFYFSVALFSARSGQRGENEEGREEGNVQWGDSQGVIRLLSEWGERQC